MILYYRNDSSFYIFVRESDIVFYTIFQRNAIKKVSAPASVLKQKAACELNLPRV